MLWFGIYIDDVFTVQIMRREAVSPLDADVRLSKAIEKAYDDTPGVAEADEKALDQQVRVTGWGTQLDGDLGTAGVYRLFRRPQISFYLLCL